MAQYLEQSTSTTVTIGPCVDSTDGVTPETGLAAGTVDEIGVYKHEGTSLVDISGDTTMTHRAGGMYTVTLDTGDTDTVGRLRLFIRDDDTCLPVWKDFMVVPSNVFDSMLGTDKLDVNVAEVSDDSAAADNLELITELSNITSLVVDASGNVAADVIEIEGSDATDQIRDALVDDATRFSGADIATILADTNELQTDDVPGLISALNDFNPTSDNVTVGDIIAAALAKFASQDTGETLPTVADGSVAKLSQGSASLDEEDIWTYATRTLTASSGSRSSLTVEITENSVELSGSIRNFYPGETVEASFTFYVDDTLQDVSGDTVTFTMKSDKGDADSSAVIQKDADAATDGATGVATLTLTADETDDISPGDYFCDVVWIKADGTVQVPYNKPVQVLTRVSDS